MNRNKMNPSKFCYRDIENLLSDLAHARDVLFRSACARHLSFRLAEAEKEKFLQPSSSGFDRGKRSPLSA